MRAVNETLPVLFGEVWLRLPPNVHRIFVTKRSYPAGAPPPSETGGYVYVKPPSSEYVIPTVIPVVPRSVLAEPSLKSVLSGLGSVTTKSCAACPPLFVNTTV